MVDRYLAQLCQVVLRFAGGHSIVIPELDIEHSNGADWRKTVVDIDDPSSLGKGTINWHGVLSSVGVDHNFVVNGGGNLTIKEI